MGEMAHELELDTIRDQVVAGAHRQAQVLEDAALGLGTLRSGVDAVRGSATRFGDVVDTAQGASQRGKEAMVELEVVNTALGQLSDRVGTILNMIQAIEARTDALHKIAARSKILSINASIQAGRAGRHGAGFGVVALAMRDLAEASDHAIGEIAGVVSEGVREAGRVSEDAQLQISAFMTSSSHTREAFDEIEDSVAAMSGALNDITSACSRQQESTAHLADQLRSASEDNARSASELISLVTGAEIREIEPRVALGELDDYVIIDVRSSSEFVDPLGHIKGARLFTLGPDLERGLCGMPKDGNYLFVCRSGGRSTRAARLAQAAGFAQVTNLTGGMLAWDAAKLPVAAVDSAISRLAG